MANELKFGNKVVFLNGIPFTLPVAASDPGSAANGDMYYNSTANQVKVFQGGAWTFLSTGASVSAGTAGQLALYPSSGSSIAGTYVQNSQNISVAIASQGSRSTSITYTIPNPGDSVSSTSFVLDQGPSTIAGTKTFTGTINLSALSASLPLKLDGSNNVTAAAIALGSSEVSGTLPIGRGGTNSGTTLNNNRVMISSGGAIVEQSAITANRALASDANGLPVASTTTDTELGYLSGVTSAIQTQINSKVAKAGDAMTGNLTFSSTFGIDSTSASGTLNIGATNATTINIGHSGSTVNVLGTLTYVQTSTLEVANPNIILNESGAAGSANGAGIQINEGGTPPASIITASILVGNTRNSWDLLAPAKSGTFRLTASSAAFIGELAQAVLTSGRTWTLPDATGTIALLGGSGGAANTALSNLVTTSINQDLLPSADVTRNLGSSILRWSNVFASTVDGGANPLTVKTSSGNNSVILVANGTGNVDVEATKIRRSQSGADSTNFMEDQYFDALTLTANTSVATEISSSLSFALASFDSCIINYKIKEATSNKTRVGQLIVTTDGTIASSSDQFSETATPGNATGLSLSADINSGNVRILYNNTNASNAATMRCHIRRLRT